MQAFRIYLIVVIACLGSYTMIVGLNHGWNFLPIFFADVFAMTWPGQFNFDFMTFLSLSGLWVAWRNRFSGTGIALGVFAFFGGMMFLAPYLLYASIRAKGIVKIILPEAAIGSPLGGVIVGRFLREIGIRSFLGNPKATARRSLIQTLDASRNSSYT